MKKTVLLMQCPDKPGIVARLSEFIFRHGANIISSDQHSTDPQGGRFFMRIVFALDETAVPLKAFEADWRATAEDLEAEYSIHFLEQRMRMGILVSKYDHCLADLLYRVRAGDLNCEVPMVISNHENARDMVERYGVPFHHVPVTKETKLEAERSILEWVRESTDFLVLARYMQIISDGFLGAYGKDIINIHHSFLPSFKGANPYRQAYDRGVKVIGATAHYATAELDEGPIIEQEVERVYYKDSVADLMRKGATLERITLANAIRAHTEHRIIRHGRKTIVFQ